MSLNNENRWKLIQQLALLAYVHRGEESKDLYKAVVGAKLLKNIWSECIKKDETKQLRNNVASSMMPQFHLSHWFVIRNNATLSLKQQEETIWAVAEFLRMHPNASEQEVQDEVEKQISIFIQKIQ